MNHEDLKHLRHRADIDPGEDLALTFDEQEQTTVINALRVAAEKYTECAKVVRAEVAAEKAGQCYDRVAEQFDRQARQALRLARRIEDME